MSVPTNLIPTTITGLPEYTGNGTYGFIPYVIDGWTYKVQFSNIAAVGAVPSSRTIATGTGLIGGGNLSQDRTIAIANGGVGTAQLAPSGVSAGVYGSTSTIPILTVDATGRITSASTASISLSGFVPTSRSVLAGTGLSGGGTLTNDVTLSVIFSNTTPQALGAASAGVSTAAARGDHVHPAVDLANTTQTQGALPLGRGGTGDALSPVAGAVVYSTGTRFALSNPGLPGQVLVSGGTDEPQWQTIIGTGSVTSVSVVTANGFAGSVFAPNTAPQITLRTTVSGLIKGDGTAISAAVAGTDYIVPGAITTSGLTMATARLLGRTTAATGAVEQITIGTGLNLSGGSLTNSAPDQTVSLTPGSGISITGTYPSFTIAATGGGGTVTSVDASGGTTGLTFTGGPIIASGTLTLGGTLAVANGGTGSTTAAGALTNLGAYPASNPSGYTSNVGTVTSVSGTGTVSGISLSGSFTTSGSLSISGTLSVLPSNFASQTANTFLAAPNGAAGTPTFRAIVAADVPTLNQNTTGTANNVTGIVALVNGGTGASTAAGARTNLGLGSAATLTAGAANGVATLDASGTVPTSQLPAAVLGALNYQGVWNASTNTPTLTSSVGTKGFYYVVDVAGSTNLNGITDWKVGDWVVYNGSVWQKVDNTDGVISVNGFTGAVVLTSSDVGAPSTTGTGASGTWGISITGNAATATNGVVTTGSYANPSWITSLAASKISGSLAIANGGTNGSATPTAGAVAYGTGTAYAFTAAGTAGQVLVSNGAGAPTYGSVNGGTF